VARRISGAERQDYPLTPDTAFSRTGCVPAAIESNACTPASVDSVDKSIGAHSLRAGSATSGRMGTTSPAKGSMAHLSAGAECRGEAKPVRDGSPTLNGDAHRDSREQRLADGQGARWTARSGPWSTAYFEHRGECVLKVLVTNLIQERCVRRSRRRT